MCGPGIQLVVPTWLLMSSVIDFGVIGAPTVTMAIEAMSVCVCVLCVAEQIVSTHTIV